MRDTAGVEVPTRRRERRDALADGVDVEAVELWRHAPHLRADVDLSVPLLEDYDSDLFAGRVLQRRERPPPEAVVVPSGERRADPRRESHRCNSRNCGESPGSSHEEPPSRILGVFPLAPRRKTCLNRG